MTKSQVWVLILFTIPFSAIVLAIAIASLGNNNNYVVRLGNIGENEASRDNSNSIYRNYLDIRTN